MKRNKKKPTRRGSCMTFNDEKIQTSIWHSQLQLFIIHTDKINKQLEQRMAKSYGSIYNDNSYCFCHVPRCTNKE